MPTSRHLDCLLLTGLATLAFSLWPRDDPGFAPDATAGPPSSAAADAGAIPRSAEAEAVRRRECAGEFPAAPIGGEGPPPANAFAAIRDTGDQEAELRHEPVTGTVFDPAGNPCAVATVRMADVVGTTAVDGTFALVATSRVAVGTPLFVIAPACSPVAMPDPRPTDGRPPPPLTVQLRPGVVITGRILDEHGKPQPQWIAVLADTTAIGGAVPGEITAEGLLGAARAVTDVDGVFRFDGVFAREYVIEAWDERGSRSLRAAIAPEDGFVTLIAAARIATTLRGVVVDGADRPVAGAVVGVARAGVTAAGAQAMCFDQRTTTKADGRFELAVRGAALHVIVEAEPFVPCRVAIPPLDGNAAPLRVRVVRRRDG